jgi:hypothetical protein
MLPKHPVYLVYPVNLSDIRKIDQNPASGGTAGIRCGPGGGPTPDETTYTGSGNGQNPSNSAISPDTPDAPDGSDGDEKGEDLSAAPNGADLIELDVEIARFGAANPTWTTERIARRFGQPRDVVARLLGRDR